MLLFNSQNQMKLFLVMVVNIPAVRHVPESFSINGKMGIVARMGSKLCL